MNAIAGMGASAATAAANNASAYFQNAQAAYNTNSANIANGLNQSFLNQQQAYNTASANTAYMQQLAYAQMVMAYNASEAQKERDWQTEMSNTSYQRAVKDMIAAGINPILAAQNGGASSGTGATASVSIPSAQMASSGLQNADMATISALSGQAFTETAALQIFDSLGQGLENFAKAFGLKDLAEAIDGFTNGKDNSLLDFLKGLFPEEKENTNNNSAKNYIKKIKSSKNGAGHGF